MRASLEKKALPAYISELNEIKDSKASPYKFLNGNSDENKSEKFMPELIQMENSLNKDLNLRQFHTIGDFSQHLNAQMGNTDAPEVERGLVMNLADAYGKKDYFHHITASEVTHLQEGTYIRIFDSLPTANAEKYFKSLCAQLRKEVDPGRPVKLEYFAVGAQQSEEGCDIFALSFAKKSHKQRNSSDFESVNVTFDPGNFADYSFVKTEDAMKRLPADFYKHTQSRTTVKKYLDINPGAEKLPVNKQPGKILENGQTLAERQQEHYMEHEAYVDREDFHGLVNLKSSVSIDAKRISELEKLAAKNEVTRTYSSAIKSGDEAKPAQP